MALAAFCCKKNKAALILLIRKNIHIETSLKYASLFFKADGRHPEILAGHTCIPVVGTGSAEGSGFESLQYFNDVFLSAGRKVKSHCEPGVAEVIVPIVGTLSCFGEAQEDIFVSPEELIIPGKTSGCYSILNPYESETINYLQLGIKGSELKGGIYPISFKQHNQLVTAQVASNFSISAGIYQGRVKGSYVLKDPSKAAFIFIVNGAFEVEDRLMEHRDGLALWDVKQINFEALSEAAILLIVELDRTA